MKKTDLIIINTKYELVRVKNFISLTNKLLSKKGSSELVLFDFDSFKKRSEIESAIIKFIQANFWHYLSFLIRGIRDKTFEDKSVDTNFYEVISMQDITYEFPRAFYRSRGNGVPNIPEFYDKEIKERNETYIWCSPKISKSFDSQLKKNINNRITGALLFNFANTSLSQLFGIKVSYIKMTNAENL